jgi:hypothetical protein
LKTEYNPGTVSALTMLHYTVPYYYITVFPFV